MKKPGDARGIVKDMPNQEDEKGNIKQAAIAQVKSSLSNFFSLVTKNITKFMFESLLIFWLAGYLGAECNYTQAMAALAIVRIALPRTVLTNNKENVKNGNEKN